MTDTVEKVARLRAFYRALPWPALSFDRPTAFTQIPQEMPIPQYQPDDDPAFVAIPQPPTARWWIKKAVNAELPGVRAAIYMCNGLVVGWAIVDDGRVIQRPINPLITAEFDEPFDHPIIPGVNDHD